MRRVLPLIVVLVMGFAPAPFPKPDVAKEDLAKMQGEWDMVFFAQRGEVVNIPPCLVIIRKNHWIYVHGGTHRPTMSVWNITVNAKKSGKSLDLADVDGEAKKTVHRGIYRLNGDELIICYRPDSPPKDRPKKLDGTEKETWYQVFRRRKP